MATKSSLEFLPVKDPQRVDEATAEIIRGLNYLLLNAQREDLTAITSILKDARQSIAWWAAHDNYTESGAERLYHLMTSDSGLYTAVDCLAKLSAIKDSVIREELLQTIRQFPLKRPLPPESKLKAYNAA